MVIADICNVIKNIAIVSSAIVNVTDAIGLTSNDNYHGQQQQPQVIVVQQPQQPQVISSMNEVMPSRITGPIFQGSVPVSAVYPSSYGNDFTI